MFNGRLRRLFNLIAPTDDNYIINKCKELLHKLFISFKKVHDLFVTEVGLQCNILIECVVFEKTVNVTDLCV